MRLGRVRWLVCGIWMLPRMWSFTQRDRISRADECGRVQIMGTILLDAEWKTTAHWQARTTDAVIGLNESAGTAAIAIILDADSFRMIGGGNNGG